MIIKKYVVNNMNEALTRIRYELGREAVIISQRKVKKPGLRGLFSEKQIEVTAAIENESKDYKKKENKVTSKKEDNDIKNSINDIKRIMRDNFNEEKEIEEKPIYKEPSKIEIKQEENNEVELPPVIEKENDKFIPHEPIPLKEIVKKVSQNKDVTQEDKNEEDSTPKKSTKKTPSKEDEGEVKKTPAKRTTQRKTTSKSGTSGNENIEEEIKNMKEILNRVLENTNHIENNKDALQEIMDEIDIDLDFYKDLKGKIDIKDIKESLRKIIKTEVRVTHEKMKGNVVLVGPTGVGKTTTIAKLAGKYSLIEKKKVGLITIDTYRIGAVEQLKTYAEIMNIPFKVAISVKEMEEALKSMEDCDIVFIDTTGRSSKNTMQISELRMLIEKAKPTSVNLVVSSSTKNSDIKIITEGYKELNYDRVIITKVDETSTYGSIYNIFKRTGKPIRYLTTGQNVPDDLMAPTKDEIAKLVLGDENVC